MITRLHPYFAGASLGWHDFLASAARLFKNDPSYRIPIKADANIVVRHIRESHLLLARIVGARGGIAIGGMYGILPRGRDVADASVQAALVGFVRDVVTQLRRGLVGFWVAHPDFVRVGVALVEAFAADAGVALNSGSAAASTPRKQITRDGYVCAVRRLQCCELKRATSARWRSSCAR